MYTTGLVLFVLIGPLVPTAQTDKPASYEGFRVYEVVLDEQNASRLRFPLDEVSILSESRVFIKKRPCTLCSCLVPGHRDEAFRKALDAADVAYTVAVSNMGKLIQEERDAVAKKRSLGDGFNSKIYLSYEELVHYLTFIENVKNPDTGEPLAVVEYIGNSYEGRDLFGVKISSKHLQKKPIIFFEAGAHAREWTGPAAALYMINQLVENYTHNEHVLRDVDFYIIPLSNPDGYEYSRARDRVWRKTRSVHVQGYYGVDLNRNFDFHWGETGSSTHPASDVYQGPFAFSEPESRSVRDAGKKYQNRLKAFVSIHSYGPYILYPWGYSRSLQASDASLLRQVAKIASEVMRKFGGSKYECGQSSVLLYESAGGSDDYFKGVFNVTLAYTVELSSRGVHSFIVAPDKVFDIVAEVFEGFKVIAQCAVNDK